MYTLKEGMEITLHPVVPDNYTPEIQDNFLQEAKFHMAFKVSKLIDNYWFIILLPLGLVGNTLSFLVMIRKSNRKVSTCIYMAAISINDNAMICMALHAWLISSLNTHRWNLWECIGSNYFALLLLQCGTYLVLAMTVYKYIAIKWPHRASTHSTPKRAKTTIVAILIVVCIYNLPHFFITTVIQEECYGFSVKSTITNVYSWLSFVVNGVIPFTLLIDMNYVIVKTVRNSRNMFNSPTRTQTRQKSIKTAENQLTTMLLLITTLFLILLLPTYLRFIYASFVSSDTPSKFATSILIFEISYKLFLTNSGINFFLYCISGKKFRSDLREILCCNERSSSSLRESA